MSGDKEPSMSFKRNTEPIEPSKLTEKDGPIQLTPEDLVSLTHIETIPGKKEVRPELAKEAKLPPLPSMERLQVGKEESKDGFCPPPELENDELYQEHFGTEGDVQNIEPVPELPKASEVIKPPTEKIVEKVVFKKQEKPVQNQLSPEELAEQERLLVEDVEGERKREAEKLRIKKEQERMYAEMAKEKAAEEAHDKKLLVRAGNWFRKLIGREEK